MVQQLTNGITNGTGFLATTTTGAVAATDWFYVNPYPPIRYDWNYISQPIFAPTGGTVPTTTNTVVYPSQDTPFVVVNANPNVGGLWYLGAFKTEKDAAAFARRQVGQDKSAEILIFKATKKITAKPVETEETDL